VNQGDDISHIVASIKSRLNDLVRANPGQRDMGTTVSGMIVIGSKALIINCGDSRVYRLNGQFLEKITKDHSIVQNLFDNGDITDDEMRTHPKKHVLTSALIGDLKPDVPEFFIKELSLQPGQRYLICSDGLWESMSLENMESCFVRDDLFEGTACLLQTALNNAAGDNISIIALEVMQ
jgi:protein phosphatase